MKIGVLVKQVPDTETKIKVLDDGSGIDENGVKFIVSPYDEFAIEEALKTKEANAGSEVTVVSLGPTRCVEAIRTALAMGCDKAIHVDDEGQKPDSFISAKALAKVIGDQGFDVVFCGKQAIDDDLGQVPQLVAEFLGWPQVMILEALSLADGKAKATRRVSGGAKEIYELPLPAVFGCEKGLNTPRYASLPGIMKAKSKPVETLKIGDLKGDATQKLEYSNFRMPPEKAPGKVLSGEVADQVKELVRLLREEAKVL